MRIFLILALIFCLGFQHSIAQNNNIKPLAEISNKAPDVESMKRKDLQRELLNYYSKAIILHSQIVAINEYPAVSVPGLPDPLPTKSSILRSEVLKYFEIAKKLQNQILTTEYQNTYELQNQIRKLQEEKDLAIKDMIIKENEMRYQSDSVSNIYLRKISDMYSRNFQHSIPIISLSLIGNNFFFKNDFVETIPSVGARVDFNSLPLLGSSDIFEFSAEYISPRFSTIHFDKVKNEIKTDWRTNFFAVGANINFPARFEFDGFSSGLKIGGGYFWGNSRIYNAENFRSDWKGGNLRFELNLRKYTKFYPLEAFLAYNIYFPSNSFHFNRPEGRIVVAENSLSSLSLGLRMCFWWVPVQ